MFNVSLLWMWIGHMEWVQDSDYHYSSGSWVLHKSRSDLQNPGQIINWSNSETWVQLDTVFLYRLLGTLFSYRGWKGSILWLGCKRGLYAGLAMTA